MLCDACNKNNASVHMTTFVGGQIKTTHLCPDCAAKKKNAAMQSPTMSDFMSAFYDEKDAETTICGTCGQTLAEFRKGGRLGCAACYEVFEAAITPVLRGVHMNLKHTGKHPGQRVKIEALKTQSTQTPGSKKASLRRELKVAVSTENYEEAAKLRDEIALLDKEGD